MIRNAVYGIGAAAPCAICRQRTDTRFTRSLCVRMQNLDRHFQVRRVSQRTYSNNAAEVGEIAAAYRRQEAMDGQSEMTNMIATSLRSRRQTVASSSSKERAERLGRMDWINAARDALIKGGVHAVKIDIIANRLKITRGSFYWHFQNRAEVLSALVELWESQNTTPFEEIVRRLDLSPAEKFVEMARLWLEEKEFDWLFDSAMRDWARTSRPIAKKLAAIDDFRVKLFEQVFDELGYSVLEAKIRARVTYYHQVGYYTLAIREDKKTRREMFPTYLQILAGETHMKGVLS